MQNVLIDMRVFPNHFCRLVANESNPFPIVLHHHPLHGILEDLVGAPGPKPGQVFFPPFVIIVVGTWTVAIGLVVLAIPGA